MRKVILGTQVLLHLLLEIVVHLVEEAFGRQPFLIGTDKQREILGHESGLDRLHAHFFQRMGEFRQPIVRIELGAMR